MTRQCCDYLAWRGWRAVRINRGVFQGPAGVFSSGEPGQADYAFCRYLDESKLAGASLILWIEFKSPTDRRRCSCVPAETKKCGVCQQVIWQERERKRGGLVWVVDDFVVFAEKYEQEFQWLHAGKYASGQLDLLLAGAC